MTSKTSRLDPRTNDPYINRYGRMELASPREELAQRFDVLVNTRVGTNLLDVSYGIDYEWIKAHSQIMEPEQAFLLELIKRIDKKVEPLILNFDVLGINEMGSMLTVHMLLRGSNDVSTEARMNIQ